MNLQRIVRAVPVTDHIIRYGSCRWCGRHGSAKSGYPISSKIKLVAWGAGPRAVQFMILGSKARALLHGRTHVSTDDILGAGQGPALRHRLVR